MTNKKGLERIEEILTVAKYVDTIGTLEELDVTLSASDVDFLIEALLIIQTAERFPLCQERIGFIKNRFREKLEGSFYNRANKYMSDHFNVE